MAADIPPQRHRCPIYEWCEERTPGHRVHVGEAHVVNTSRGTELRVSVTANAHHGPVLLVEGAFNHGGPMMELTELDPQEAVDLAELFLRLAHVARESRRQVH